MAFRAKPKRALEMRGALAIEAGGRVTCFRHAGHAIQTTGRDMYGTPIVVFGKCAAEAHGLRCEECEDRIGDTILNAD